MLIKTRPNIIPIDLTTLASQPLNLELDEAFVFLVEAEAVLAQLPAHRLALPAEESARIARYRNEQDRRARRAAHGLARHCLGGLLSRDPRSLHFIRDEKGRPFLQERTSFDFNISHSGAWIALGLSNGGRIGVDVQEGRDDFDWRAIAEAYLHADEITSINRCAPQDQQAAALELWCLKEAFLKATGEGLLNAPHHLHPHYDGQGWTLSHHTYDLKAGAMPLPAGAQAAWASEKSITAQVTKL